MNFELILFVMDGVKLMILIKVEEQTTDTNNFLWTSNWQWEHVALLRLTLCLRDVTLFHFMLISLPVRVFEVSSCTVESRYVIFVSKVAFWVIMSFCCLANLAFSSEISSFMFCNSSWRVCSKVCSPTNTRFASFATHIFEKAKCNIIHTKTCINTIALKFWKHFIYCSLKSDQGYVLPTGKETKILRNVYEKII